ncbi:DUF1173 family protein [Burkholderia gladioli]|uniref:DUF1173 family protein n=1 Tax=Burkholderia gladioli TaxID=28095 RepID=UPI003B97F748
MTDQIFRSGKPVTPRSIVSAAIAGDISADEAEELVQLLIEARARGLDVHEPARRNANASSRGTGTGIATVQEVSTMLVTDSWIPFETLSDHALLKTLAKRRYQKCLRYNQTAKHPIATALLTDAERGTALYIVPPEASSSYQAELDLLIADSDLDAWTWRPGSETMPALPLTAYEAARLGSGRARPAAAPAMPPVQAESPIEDEPPPSVDMPADTENSWPTTWL